MAANVGQFGLLFTTQPLSPSLDSLNPIAGAKKLFGMQGLVEMLKSIIKFAIVFIFMFTFVQHLLPELLALTHCPLVAIPGKIGKLTLGISWRIVAALILLAVADYVYQRYAFKKSLRMTKEEVKDERKQSEGDEHTRSRIRARQLALTRNRMLAAVPKALV